MLTAFKDARMTRINFYKPLQFVRHSRGASLKAVNTNLSVVNQCNNRQNLAILCTKHATVVRQTLIFSALVSNCVLFHYLFFVVPVSPVLGVLSLCGGYKLN